MAKMVLLCHRDGSQQIDFTSKILKIAKRIAPDNIPLIMPKIICQKGIHIGIFSPTNALPVNGTSVAAGMLFERCARWHQPQTQIPDGSMALFRTDSNVLEVTTDAVASRTIWFVHDTDFFIAATSQRIIIHLLESFNINPIAVGWMLASGTLGPGLSWDKRLKFLPPLSKLTLCRESWLIEIEREPAIFNCKSSDAKLHEQTIESEIKHVFDRIELNQDEWVIPLSGGYDSRLLLVLLHQRYPGLKCVTWGTQNSIDKPNSDACLAKKLCECLNVEHQYFELDILRLPIETVFNRFIMMGEGRNQDIAGYLDGFELWKILYENGIRGIIRGEEAFGSRYVRSELDVRKLVHATLFSDCHDSAELFLPSSLTPNLPEAFQRQSTESLATWRDRLYVEFLYAFNTAALNELKAGYMEIMAPFVSKRIIKAVRAMPDNLRTEKRLFKAIVTKHSPKIPIAKFPAIDLRGNFLKIRQVKDFLFDELMSAHCRQVLPNNMLYKTIDKVHRNRPGGIGQRYPLLTKIRPFLPHKSVKNLQNLLPIKDTINYFDIILRCYIISRTTRMLERDAAVLSSDSDNSSAFLSAYRS